MFYTYLSFIFTSYACIGKRYTVLCSFPSEVKVDGHAAVAVTVVDEVYIKVYISFNNYSVCYFCVNYRTSEILCNSCGVHQFH